MLTSKSNRLIWPLDCTFFVALSLFFLSAFIEICTHGLLPNIQRQLQKLNGVRQGAFIEYKTCVDV